jgi:hypothetical protein
VTNYLCQIIRWLIFGAILVPLVEVSPARADPYEDNCVLAVAKILPAATTVQQSRVSPAPPATVSALDRVTTLRWVQVDLTMAVGGMRIQKSYICSENKAGERIVVPTDRLGPPPLGSYTVR